MCLEYMMCKELDAGPFVCVQHLCLLNICLNTITETSFPKNKGKFSMFMSVFTRVQNAQFYDHSSYRHSKDGILACVYAN